MLKYNVEHEKNWKHKFTESASFFFNGMKLSLLSLQTTFIINFPTLLTKFMTGAVPSGHIKLKFSIDTSPTLRARYRS